MSHEEERGSLQGLFKAMLSAADRFRCWKYLADLSRGYESWQLQYMFGEIKRYSGGRADLIYAPLAGSFGIGVSLLKDWASAVQEITENKKGGVG